MTTTAPGPTQGLTDFWAVYDAHYDDIRRRIFEAAEYPQVAALLARMPEAKRDELAARSRSLLRQAISDGDWQPYLDHLRDQGRAYAEMSMPFDAWFSLTTAFRGHLVPLLASAYEEDRDRLLAALSAMSRFIDRALSTIGEAYLEQKQAIILRQHAAIEELSTPVLQLREGLLLQPIIGVIDSARARQLTEAMLQAIRAHRGRVVVMDITGVAEVDSEVANRLLQTARAAGLMGAKVIVTGLSAGVAQALVTLGVDLGRLRTLGSLRDGIDEANRILGYQVIRGGSAPALDGDGAAP